MPPTDEPTPRHRALLGLGVGVATVLLVALVLGLATASPTGVEDNGDGYRLFCGAGLAPDTADGYASWKGGVVGEFVRSAPCDDRQPSSAWLILKASTVGHPETWSLATLGWWYAALSGVVAGLAAWAAAAGGLRRAAVIAVPVAPLALPLFSRFFVSTYSEPAGLLGTVAVACGVAALLATGPEHRGARAVALALTAGGGLVAATAKVAYLPVLGVALVACAVATVGRRRWRRVAGPAVALVTVVATVVPLGAAVERQAADYASVNAHNIVFTLVLLELGPSSTGPLGLPPEAAALTGNGYFNGPDRPDLPWWNRAILEEPETTRRAALALLAERPATVARAVGVGLQATTHADLSYLAAAPADPSLGSGESGDPGRSGAQQPYLSEVLTLTRRPAWAPSLLVVLGVLALAASAVPAVRRRSAGAARWGVGAGLASLTAVGLVLVAVLGDGYYEVFKHVWLAAYLLVVAAVCLVGAVFTGGRAAVGGDGAAPRTRGLRE